MGKVTFIRASGKAAVFENVAKPSLEALQAMVDGYIERVPNWDALAGEPCVVYCNEEGLIDGLPVNHSATVMWRAELDDAGEPYSKDMATLHGDIVILTGDRDFLA